jgi:hypothetical protein
MSNFSQEKLKTGVLVAACQCKKVDIFRDALDTMHLVFGEWHRRCTIKE